MSSTRRSIENVTSPRSRPGSSYMSSSAHDSPQRPNLSGPVHSRRSSIASSITSVGGPLSSPASRLRDPIAESSNNAISTLLQPPIVRTGLLPHTTGPSAPKPPSSRDIPPVTLTNIPNIDDKVFKDYVSQAGLLYESFRRAKEGGEDGRPSSSRRGSKPEPGTSDPITSSVQKYLPTSPTLTRTDSSFSIPPDSTYRRKSSGTGRRAGPAVAPLSTIPNVYFEEEFRLENPRTFDIVSERAEIVRPPAGANGAPIPSGGTGKKALAANAILQEKLSWYMDTVEIHLISSISTASTSFFAALGSLRELHAEAEDSVAKIKTLREDLESLDSNMAVGGLKVVALKRKRENVRKLGEAIQQLEEIVRLMGECENQVEEGQIEEALKSLASVERLMAGDADDLPVVAQSQTPLGYRGKMIDLRGIKALDGAGADIAYLRKRIGKAYEAKFIETLLEDLRRHVDTAPANATFQRWDKASSRLRGQHVRSPSDLPTYMNVDGVFRSTLHSHLKGLARSDSITTAAIAYREAILKEFKNLIRRHLPSSSDDDVESTTSIATSNSNSKLSRQERSSILARNLRALEAEDAESMFKKVYANVGEALRRLGTQVKVLLDITSNLGSPQVNLPLKTPPRTPQMLSPPQSATVNGFLAPEPSPGPPPALIRQEEIQQTLDLSSLLGQAVDIAQDQITKILKVRVEQTTRMEMPFFLRYFTLNRLFADECEAVSGRTGNSLKSIVHDHIKTFVNLIAEAEKQKLIQNMDADKWDAKDFTDEDAQRLKQLVTASTKPIDSWTKATWVWDEASIMENGGSINGVLHNSAQERVSTPANGTTAPKDKARGALLDEEKYILPESAINVLGGIETFEQLLQGIPSMSVEICGCILDFIKIFNSRSSQLILGAGATRSAGLKNITTKHLALSSQALNFITAVIPYVREFARRYLPSSSGVMSDFDDIKRRLQEHRLGIHDKLVEIMTGRAASHIETMKKVDWEATSEAQVNSYMETLIKETTTLHKVLARHLFENDVKMIIIPVLANYRDRWGKAFQAVIIKSQNGKDRLIRDADFFKGRISKIEGSGDIGDYLYNIAKEKAIQTAGSEGEPATNGAPSNGT